jgi:hypothetical protein
MSTLLKYFGIKKIWHVVVLIALIAMGCIVYFAVKSSFITQKVATPYSHFTDDPVLNREFGRIIHNTAWLNARLSMTEDDSLGLSINLPDSIVSIEFKGITLGSFSIVKSQQSRFFNHLSEESINYFFSSPLMPDTTITNTQRVVIHKKRAPRDTAELRIFTEQEAKNKVKAEDADVAFDYHFENGIILSFRGVHITERGFVSNTRGFDFAQRLQQSKSFAKKSFSFQTPEFHPTIKVYLLNSEAKAILRALPYTPKIAVRVNI